MITFWKMRVNIQYFKIFIRYKLCIDGMVFFSLDIEVI